MNKTKRLSFLFYLFVLFVLTANICFAQFEVPELTGPVIDQAGVLSREARRVGENLISEIQKSGSAQIQVLLVESLNGESIESASIKVVDKWQLGTAQKDNGVLFFAAIKDRRMRIEVGQGLEGDLPDALAKRIIADRVTPFFRNGQYSEGVIVAIGEIARIVDPKFASERREHSADAGAFGVDNEHGAQENDNRKRRSKKGMFSNDLFVFFFFLIWFIIIKIFGRRRRYFWGAGTGWSAGSSGWGSSRGWSSGSGGWGGGGWSGGGGGFSGGGASGGW
jgi:uncharacterized protein